MKVIGISGRMGHGKDTVIELTKELYPQTYRIAFADPLKEEAAYAIALQEALPSEEFCSGVPTGAFFLKFQQRYDQLLREFHDHEAKKRWRMLLQFWGTEYRRFDNDRYWLDKLKQRLIEMNEALPSTAVVFVSDVRFPNEADLVKEVGGVLAKVERPGFSAPGSEAHASESSMDSVPMDYVVTNNGSLEDLSKAVENNFLPWILNSGARLTV